MTQRSLAAPLSLAAALAALSGCGLDTQQLRPATSPRRPLLADATPVVASPPAEGVETGLPHWMRCVSAPLPDTTDVLRVEMERSVDGTFKVAVQRGPQFWSHEGQWFGANGEEWPTAVIHTLTETTKGVLVEDSDGGRLTIDLDRDGALLAGTFEDAQCYQHTEATLTCWNDVELFGSAWAGIPGALPAHFNWGSGECVDADGAPAMNALPLAVVRETGFAECTALEGRLNGDDFSYPDLVGWNLMGADLSGAELFFANLTSATLFGTDLSEFTFGYATVSGSFDDTTTRPVEGECSEVESPWAGTTLECVR